MSSFFQFLLELVRFHIGLIVNLFLLVNLETQAFSLGTVANSWKKVTPDRYRFSQFFRVEIPLEVLSKRMFALIGMSLRQYNNTGRLAAG